jgi:hypothetical protein
MRRAVDRQLCLLAIDLKLNRADPVIRLFITGAGLEDQLL